jgi:hypothetical protein
MDRKSGLHLTYLASQAFGYFLTRVIPALRLRIFLSERIISGVVKQID